MILRLLAKIPHVLEPLQAPPSLELRALAQAVARSLNDGRLALMSDHRRGRLREIALEIEEMADREMLEEEDRIEILHAPDNPVKACSRG